MKLSFSRVAPAFKLVLSHLLPLMVLAGFGGIVVGTGMVGFQFIMEPKSVAWLNDYLPENFQIPLADWDRPHTLEEIKKNLEKSDLKLGEWTELPKGDRLTTVSQPRYNCISRCDRIIELRIYRNSKAYGPKKNVPHFRMIAQVAVASSNDRVILESLQASNPTDLEIEDDLPLETLETLAAPENGSGIWLNLFGKRTQGESDVTYGQLFHYDRDRAQLTALIQWASPTDTPPQWKQSTGKNTNQLLIDQSIGLEPRFQLYLLSKVNSTPELTLVSLAQPALKIPEFQQAIKLAQAKLWSIAADRLKSIKTKDRDWSPGAQAQLDLINYHAKVSHDQTQQTWNNPTQELLAQLLDGQWKRAIEVMEKDPSNNVEVHEGIALEVPRLWQRISAAIQDDPSNPYLQAWTARLIYDRDGKTKAIAWINQQASSANRTDAIKFLAPELISISKTATQTNSDQRDKQFKVVEEPPTRFNTQPEIKKTQSP